MVVLTQKQCWGQTTLYIGYWGKVSPQAQMSSDGLLYSRLESFVKSFMKVKPLQS